MGPKTQKLLIVLDQLIEVLEHDGDMHWSQWMRNTRARLLASDYSGITYLLSAYGGMGSFNDVVLGQSRVNGVFTWKPGYIELNEQFDTLRAEAARLAEAIRDSQN